MRRNDTNPTTSKTALITGASSGIGSALAEYFARDGYDLVLAARGVERMEALAVSLRLRHGFTVSVIAADLETCDGPGRLHAEIKRRGIILSALANNAGVGMFGEFKDAALAPALAMMQLNMNAVVALTQLFLPDLLATGGKILNTASTAAFQPGPNMAVYYATKAFVLSFSEAIAAERPEHPGRRGQVYYATKAFVLSFSEAIAAELEGSGVTVTALCPGPTSSGFQDKAEMNASALVKGRTLPTADTVAQAGFEAMLRGQRVVIPGVRNWLIAHGPRFAPRKMVTGFVKTMSRAV